MGDPSAFLENVGLVHQHHYWNKIPSHFNTPHQWNVFPRCPFWTSQTADQGCSPVLSNHHREFGSIALALQSNSWRLFPAHNIPFSGSVPGLCPWPACSPPVFQQGWINAKASSPYMQNIFGSSPQAPHRPSPQDPSELPPCHLNYSSCSRIIHKPTGSTVTVFFWLWLPQHRAVLGLPSAHLFPLSVVQRELSCSQNPSHICQDDHS